MTTTLEAAPPVLGANQSVDPKCARCMEAVRGANTLADLHGALRELGSVLMTFPKTPSDAAHKILLAHAEDLGKAAARALQSELYRPDLQSDLEPTLDGLIACSGGTDAGFKEKFYVAFAQAAMESAWCQAHGTTHTRNRILMNEADMRIRTMDAVKGAMPKESEAA